MADEDSQDDDLDRLTEIGGNFFAYLRNLSKACLFWDRGFPAERKTWPVVLRPAQTHRSDPSKNHRELRPQGQNENRGETEMTDTETLSRHMRETGNRILAQAEQDGFRPGVILTIRQGRQFRISAIGLNFTQWSRQTAAPVQLLLRGHMWLKSNRWSVATHTIDPSKVVAITTDKRKRTSPAPKIGSMVTVQYPGHAAHGQCLRVRGFQSLHEIPLVQLDYDGQCLAIPLATVIQGGDA